METSRLVQVRKFVRETLNLADTAQIMDFGLRTKEGKLFVSATIEQQIGIEDLAEMGNLNLGNRQTNKFTPKEKRPLKRTGAYSLYRDFEINPKDFFHAKQVLRSLRKTGKLTTQEVETMTSFAGEQFPMMTTERKQQFVDMIHSIRDRMSEARNVSNN